MEEVFFSQFSSVSLEEWTEIKWFNGAGFEIRQVLHCLTGHWKNNPNDVVLGGGILGSPNDSNIAVRRASSLNALQAGSPFAACLAYFSLEEKDLLQMVHCSDLTLSFFVMWSIHDYFSHVCEGALLSHISSCKLHNCKGKIDDC